MKIKTTDIQKEHGAQEDYDAAMDSVNLLKAGQPADMSDEDWADCVQRNKDHLQIQIDKGSEYYGDLDLTPFQDAIDNA